MAQPHGQGRVFEVAPRNSPPSQGRMSRPGSDGSSMAVWSGHEQITVLRCRVKSNTTRSAGWSSSGRRRDTSCARRSMPTYPWTSRRVRALIAVDRSASLSRSWRKGQAPAPGYLSNERDRRDDLRHARVRQPWKSGPQHSTSRGLWVRRLGCSLPPAPAHRLHAHARAEPGQDLRPPLSRVRHPRKPTPYGRGAVRATGAFASVRAPNGGVDGHDLVGSTRRTSDTGNPRRPWQVTTGSSAIEAEFSANAGDMQWETKAVRKIRIKARSKEPQRTLVIAGLYEVAGSVV